MDRLKAIGGKRPNLYGGSTLATEPAAFTWPMNRARLLVKRRRADISQVAGKKQTRGRRAGAAATRPRISLNMIVKDEADFIEECLASVKDVVDEIVVVDTGSSDRTPELARSLGAQVHSFAWCDDFAAARNHGLKHCTGDWVLSLDADEQLDPETKSDIRREVAKDRVDVWYLRIVNLYQGAEAGGEVRLARLFRRVPGMKYIGRIHEQPDQNLANAVAGHSQARILHHGYDPDVMRSKNKHARNVALLESALRESEDGPPMLRSNYLHYWAMAAHGAERLRRFEMFAAYIEHHPDLTAQRIAWIPSGLLHYAVALRNVGRPREAAKVARDLLTRFGEAPYLHALVAAGALAEGHIEEAETEVRRALAADAPLDAAHREYVIPSEILRSIPQLVLAQLEERRRRWPQAEQAYASLVAKHESVRPRLAYVQLIQGKHLDALATIENGSREKSDCGPDLSCLAFVLSLIARSSAGLLWWGERVRANAAAHGLSASILSRVERWSPEKPFQLKDFPELVDALQLPLPN